MKPIFFQKRRIKRLKSNAEKKLQVVKSCTLHLNGNLVESVKKISQLEKNIEAQKNEIYRRSDAGERPDILNTLSNQCNVSEGSLQDQRLVLQTLDSTVYSIKQLEQLIEKYMALGYYHYIINNIPEKKLLRLIHGEKEGYLFEVNYLIKSINDKLGEIADISSAEMNDLMNYKNDLNEANKIRADQHSSTNSNYERIMAERKQMPLPNHSASDITSRKNNSTT